jgi:hypothetical protein
MRKWVLIVFSIVVLGAPPAAAEFVVLSSTQASVAVGAVIGDTQKIKLAANKTILLIDKAGRTITVNGPFDGVVKGPGGGGGRSKLVRALSGLIRDNEEDAHSVGAIRAVAKQKIEQTVTSKEAAMVINISETGDYCLLPDNKRELIRYHTEPGGEVTLTAVADGTAHVVPWPKNAAKVTWPTELKIEDGARFLVSQAGKDSRTLITVHALAAEAPTEAHLAVSLIAKECIEQARLILVYIRRSAK